MMKNINASGVVKIPSSKSMLARQLILSMLAKKAVTIKAQSQCLDIITLINCIKNIGFSVVKKNGYITVKRQNKLNYAKFSILNSGTAYRFLLCYCAFNQKAVIKISKQLVNRPIKPLLKALRLAGAKIYINKNIITVKKIANKNYTKVASNISSQFLSGIILANAGKNFTLNIIGDEIFSIGYLNLTISMIKQCKCDINFNKNSIVLAKSSFEFKNNWECEPDFSSACYFWALGALSNSYVGVYTNQQKSYQPDFYFYKVLQKLGADVKIKNNSICVKKNKLKGITVNLNTMPDQVITLAVLALFANCKTSITNISHLKYKESNRITGLVSQLSKIGAKISYNNGSLIIHPIKKIKPARLNTFLDHRFVMAFTILKKLAPCISISASRSVKKSYPNFFDDLNLVF